MNEEIENILHREDIQLASIPKRAMAFLIDDFLISLIIVFSFPEIATPNLTNEQILELVQSILFEIILIKIFYQTFFIMQYGATIGKLAMKIRVIEVKTLQNPNVLSSLNRAIFKIISLMAYGLGYLWGVFDPARQAWHDKTAKTLVVNA